MTAATIAPQLQACSYARAGLLALREGEYARSRQFLTQAVRLDPNLGEAWRWLAALHEGARQAICMQWAQRTLPAASLPRLPNIQTPNATTAAAQPVAHRRIQRTVALGSGVLLAAALVLGGFELAYADKIYPGVAVLGQSLSGLSAPQAQQRLAPQLAGWSQRWLLVQAGTHSWRVAYSSLGDFDPAALTASAYQIGRSGGLTERLRSQGNALLSEYRLDALPLRETMLAHILDVTAAELERPVQDARLLRDAAGTWMIVAEQPGLALDRPAAEQALRAAWSANDWSAAPADAQVLLPVQTLAPAITAAQLQPLLPLLQAQTSAPLRIEAGSDVWELDRMALLDVQTLPTLSGHFRANRAAVRQWLTELAASYDQTPQASLLVRDGNRATEWRLPQAGRTLDVAAAEPLLVAALEQADATPVLLPVQVTAPPPGDLEALGITGVLSEGNSQFASYSSPNRDANVVSGGNEFDGLLIAPGETVSFNATVGEITAAKGYQMGEMIAGGQVVPSFGGGICQVSTTFFRAAFWGGLEIEERHFHSWRLDWYEADAPPGMDATIALGGPDLKIRNTTDSYILVDVTTDLEAKTQTFTLYGAPQPTTVNLLGPAWSNGGVVIERQIMRDGAEIDRDQWISYYQ